MNAMHRHIGLPYHGSRAQGLFTGGSIMAATFAAALGVAIGLGVGAYTWRDNDSPAPAVAGYTFTTEGYTGEVNEALFDGTLPLEAPAATTTQADRDRIALEQHEANIGPYPVPFPERAPAAGAYADPYVGEVNEALIDGTMPLEAPGAMFLDEVAAVAREHEMLVAGVLGN